MALFIVLLVTKISLDQGIKQVLLSIEKYDILKSHIFFNMKFQNLTFLSCYANVKSV